MLLIDAISPDERNPWTTANRLKPGINNPRTFVARPPLGFTSSLRHIRNFLTIRASSARGSFGHSGDLDAVANHSLVIVLEELATVSFVPFRHGSADQRFTTLRKTCFAVRRALRGNGSASRARWKIVRCSPTPAISIIGIREFLHPRPFARVFGRFGLFYCWITLAIHGVCLKFSSSLEYRKRTSISSIPSLILAAARAFHFSRVFPG